MFGPPQTMEIVKPAAPKHDDGWAQIRQWDIRSRRYQWFQRMVEICSKSKEFEDYIHSIPEEVIRSEMTEQIRFANKFHQFANEWLQPHIQNIKQVVRTQEMQEHVTRTLTLNWELLCHTKEEISKKIEPLLSDAGTSLKEVQVVLEFCRLMKDYYFYIQSISKVFFDLSQVATGRVKG